MGERIAPGAARQISEPTPGRFEGLLAEPAAIGEIGQHAEHRPDRKGDPPQRRQGRRPVAEEDNDGGRQRTSKCRRKASRSGSETAAPPGEHRADHHRDDAGGQDRHKGGIEILRPDAQFDAAPYLGKERIESAEKDRRHAAREQEVVEHQGALAADRRERVADLEARRAQRVEQQPAADHQPDKHQDEDPAGRVDGERVDRGQDAGAHQEGADQAHAEGQDRQQHGPALQGLALFDGGRRVQQRRSEQPRHEGGVLDRVPIPPAAPAEHVIGPPAAQRDADREPAPGGERPGPHPARPLGADPPLDQRGDRKGVGDREPDIAEIEEGRMEGEPRILQ